MKPCKSRDPRRQLRSNVRSVVTWTNVGSSHVLSGRTFRELASCCCWHCPWGVLNGRGLQQLAPAEILVLRSPTSNSYPYSVSCLCLVLVIPLYHSSDHVLRRRPYRVHVTRYQGLDDSFQTDALLSTVPNCLNCGVLLGHCSLNSHQRD